MEEQNQIIIELVAARNDWLQGYCMESMDRLEILMKAIDPKLYELIHTRRETLMQQMENDKAEFIQIEKDKQILGPDFGDQLTKWQLRKIYETAKTINEESVDALRDAGKLVTAAPAM